MHLVSTDDDSFKLPTYHYAFLEWAEHFPNIIGALKIGGHRKRKTYNFQLIARSPDNF